MRKLFFLLLTLASCISEEQEIRQSISLAGKWNFRIDSLDQGINEKWYNEIADETVMLPGSMAENNKGDEVTLNTPWTGDIVDKSYFSSPKYAKYRQPGNIKIPFWLKPVRYYKGVAWYQKEFDMPGEWKNRNIELFLERPHWETTVYVNGQKAGSQNSLAVPHQYEISGLLHDGKNLISIRVDNSIIIPVGVNSHSISDHTQSNWNGISGEISLRCSSPVFISDVSIYPDLEKKAVRVITQISNKSGNVFDGDVILRAERY